MRKEYPTLDNERRMLRDGYHYIAGIDEAGRGAWAGPVVAAAVILPLDDPDLEHKLEGVCDSKLCTPRQRENLRRRICGIALAWAATAIPASTIDRIGIVPSTRLAMAECISQLGLRPDALLIDALALPSIQLTQRALVRGDRQSLVIAAASILAKTSRDHEMIAFDADFPGYGFARHKGYGTQEHQRALFAQGPTEIHRWSFAPVAAVGRGQQDREPVAGGLPCSGSHKTGRRAGA
jgi:ribonuclease HII